MRILVVSDQWFPDYTGGAARYATELSYRLAERGHGVHAIAPHGTKEQEPVRITATFAHPGVPSTLANPIATFTAARRLRREAFDVVIAHQITGARGCARALPDVPLALVYHASATREARLRDSGASAARRLKTAVLGAALARLERNAVAAASVVVPLSAYSRGLVERDYPLAATKIAQLRGAVDTERFRPPEPDVMTPLPLLLIVRRLEVGLGVEQALDAAALLTRESALDVKVAGSGPDAPLLQERARSLELERPIEFLGDVPSEVLAELYRRAHVVLIPPAPHEGFGLAAIEALASGRPAVGRTGALATILGDLDEALVADDDSPAALAAAVRRALDRSADTGFRQRCRSYALENFAWEPVTTDWESMLESLVAA